MSTTTPLLDFFKASLPLLGAIIGASAALLGGFLSDRRKAQVERRNAQERERTLLTGMFVVRNHIAQRLIDYKKNSLASGLERLRSAHRYVDKLLDKTPPQGEALLMAVIEIGLKLDALISTLDRRATDPSLKDPLSFARTVTDEIDELEASLEQFDLIARASLSFLSEEDYERMSSAAGTPED